MLKALRAAWNRLFSPRPVRWVFHSNIPLPNKESLLHSWNILQEAQEAYHRCRREGHYALATDLEFAARPIAIALEKGVTPPQSALSALIAKVSRAADFCPLLEEDDGPLLA